VKTDGADVDKFKRTFFVRRAREAATSVAETDIFCAFNVPPGNAVEFAAGKKVPEVDVKNVVLRLCACQGDSNRYGQP
jgi:hypothetical protein